MAVETKTVAQRQTSRTARGKATSVSSYNTNGNLKFILRAFGSQAGHGGHVNLRDPDALEELYGLIGEILEAGFEHES